MKEHGVGNFGVKVTWKDSKREPVTYWKTTKISQNMEYKIFSGTTGVKSAAKVTRND